MINLFELLNIYDNIIRCENSYDYYYRNIELAEFDIKLINNQLDDYSQQVQFKENYISQQYKCLETSEYWIEYHTNELQEYINKKPNKVQIKGKGYCLLFMEYTIEKAERECI